MPVEASKVKRNIQNQSRARVIVKVEGSYKDTTEIKREELPIDNNNSSDEVNEEEGEDGTLAEKKHTMKKHTRKRRGIWTREREEALVRLYYLYDMNNKPRGEKMVFWKEVMKEINAIEPTREQLGSTSGCNRMRALVETGKIIAFKEYDHSSQCDPSNSDSTPPTRTNNSTEAAENDKIMATCKDSTEKRKKKEKMEKKEKKGTGSEKGQETAERTRIPTIILHNSSGETDNEAENLQEESPARKKRRVEEVPANTPVPEKASSSIVTGEKQVIERMNEMTCAVNRIELLLKELLEEIKKK